MIELAAENGLLGLPGIYLAIFGAVSTIGAGLFVAKSASKSKAAEIWEGEAEALRERANRLHDDLDQQLETNRILGDRIAKLETLPDMTKVMEALAGQMEMNEERYRRGMEQVGELFSNHEERAAQRHEATIRSFAELNKSLAAMSAGMIDLIERMNATRVGGRRGYDPSEEEDRERKNR